MRSAKAHPLIRGALHAALTQRNPERQQMRNIILYVKPDLKLQRTTKVWAGIRTITEDMGQKRRWAHIAYDNHRVIDNPSHRWVVFFYNHRRNNKYSYLTGWEMSSPPFGSWGFRTEAAALKAARRWIADQKLPKQYTPKHYDMSWMD